MEHVVAWLNNWFRIVRFDQPLVLLLIPLFLVVSFIFWRLFRSYERGTVFSDLEIWIKPTRGLLHAFILKASLAIWVIASITGLAVPVLFVAHFLLPLYNVGFILVIDASLSMAAEEDIFGVGGRFGAALREITGEFTTLLNEKVRPRMGVVLFAGSTRRSFVLYDDYGRFLQNISSATVFPANDQGSNFEAALGDALDLCTGVKDLIYCGVAMITDGDREAETPGLFSEVLPKFVEKRIRLDVVGVGKNTAPLPAVGDLGSPSYFNDKGELVPVTTKYDADFLEKIATAAGGMFYEYGERGILRKHIRSIRSVMEHEVRQRTKRWLDVSEYCFMAATFFLFLHLVLLVPFNRILVKKMSGKSMKN